MIWSSVTLKNNAICPENRIQRVTTRVMMSVLYAFEEVLSLPSVSLLENTDHCRGFAKLKKIDLIGVTHGEN